MPINDEKEEDDLWEEFKKTKSPSLRDKFIRQYMPLVKYVAGKVAVGLPASVEFDDLVGYVLYGSDSAKVQSNLNKLTEIMYGRPLSMSEAISVSELQEGYTSFDDIDDEY